MNMFYWLSRALAVLCVMVFVAIVTALTLDDRAPVVLHIFRDTAKALTNSIETHLGVELKRSYIPVTSDQFAHILLWFFAMLLIGWLLKDLVPIIVTAFVLCIAGIISEFLQPIFSATRQFSIADAGANVVGVGLACLVLLSATAISKLSRNSGSSRNEPTSEMAVFRRPPGRG